MKVETSVVLPEELWAEIDKADADRSGFIERAARWYLNRIAGDERGARDLEIVNANAEYLTEEALDVLEYQVYMDELADKD